MLLTENGGGSQKSDLFTVHYCLKGGPERHLRFPKTNIPANEAIHWLFFLHILFDLIDCLELINRLGERKRVLKFLLPFLIRRKRMPFVCVTGGLQAKQIGGKIESGYLRSLFYFCP